MKKASPSRAGPRPPYSPFEDCATFTKTQMCLAQCGDCGSLSEVQLGNVSIWRARVPCGGLNLLTQLVGAILELAADHPNASGPKAAPTVGDLSSIEVSQL
jgi:hypothetical protein